MIPRDLRYSNEHEWVRIESEVIVCVGITKFAVDELGDVVFLDLPPIGSQLTQFDKLGEIESVKAVSDLYSPVSGVVLEINDEAVDNPQLVNDSPYDLGWILRVEVNNSTQIDNLMHADDYEAYLSSQED
jgi:glycine cleavage system H protein